MYRARDTTLDRDVALKVLPEAFTSDPDRLARFEREAKVLASLNHPNIGGIHGLEESEGIKALVLELVEGPTLEDRIKQGPIPVDEALPIAKQIAEALEAAHEQGIIHRDLKPANIKLRPDGAVKVLDFGLAKAVDTTPEGDPNDSPTLTAAATQMGVIMGTAAYMSPEQARGKPVDKRADIWAFGAVLFEMLTGQRAFRGEDASLTLSAILERAPDWGALPPRLPPGLEMFLCGCLEKDLRKRVRDLGDVQWVMGYGSGARSTSSAESATSRQFRIWQRPTAALIAALALVTVGGLGVWVGTGANTTESPTKRFAVTLPDSDQLPRNRGGPLVALSPAGDTLVYLARRDGSERLFRRPIDQFEGIPIPDTEGARNVFVSADGEWIGFLAQPARASASELRKIPLVGGPAQTLTSLPSGLNGADWGVDDVIVFTSFDGNLMEISAAGGDARLIFSADDGRDVRHPQLLAGGEVVLVTVSDLQSSGGELHLFVRNTGEHRVLLPNAIAGRVLESGHLVFVRSGALWAGQFDAEALEVVGNPVPLINGVRVDVNGGVHVAVAADGSLAYVPAGPEADQRLVWVDRDGNEEPLEHPTGGYSQARVSPDGRHIAVSMTADEGNSDIWILDTQRGTSVRLTSHLANDWSPAWAPDGEQVAFFSIRGPGDGGPGIFLGFTEGTSEPDRISSGPHGSPAWVPDGTRLLFEADFQLNARIGIPEVGDGSTRTLVRGGARYLTPVVSPDGRWLAYASDETGTVEVWVRPFPDVQAEQERISVGGGRDPVWSGDGSALFFRSDRTILRVAVTEGPPSACGQPEPLFEAGRRSVFSGAFRTFDVGPDGRFLMIAVASSGNATSSREQIHVVLNWPTELLERVPVN